MSSYYQSRIEKLSKKLSSDQGWIIEHPTDIYYLTGFALSEGVAMVGASKLILFVDGRYIAAAKKLDMQVMERNDDGFEKALYEEFTHVHSWCVDGAKMTLSGMQKWEERVEKFHKKRAKEAKRVLAIKKDPVLGVRAVKDEKELMLLRESAEILIQGVHHLKDYLKEGMSERQAALEFELFCKGKGAEALSFEPIVAFGEKGAYPHYRPGDNKLNKGDPVLLDLGVVKNRYTSDMTRCFCFEGQYSGPMQKLYEVTKEAKNAAMKVCRAGAVIGELDEAARAVMKQYGLEDLYPHSLGHGVGLDVHELPMLRTSNKEKLEENMVITIEPGLYKPGLGGIRLEDTVVVTKQGYLNFFENLPL